jgi:SAM-dependent methyltransferase
VLKGILKKLKFKIASWYPTYFHAYSLTTNGYLYNKGWFKSGAEGKCVDLCGNPIPWFTYPFIDFIAKKIHSQMTVFEYGCGFSTIWWSKMVKEVVSIEHDKKWYEMARSAVPENVRIHFVELKYDGDYSRKISEYENKFDIVVIDGRDRINCTKNSLRALKEDGVIIFDNSDRDCYQEGYDFLENVGFKRIDFDGMGPINNYSWRTSIFYRAKNCLNI